jgi:hypothetical protein
MGSSGRFVGLPRWGLLPVWWGVLVVGVRFLRTQQRAFL